ncbi:helix-turn-helix domain-containing protein [Alistipes sp.]|uniref:helix-turn-helix domain-containing protein n=1 Tax=Alistipes sp. TaxID=1872444 RepID=UPI003A8B09E4
MGIVNVESRTFERMLARFEEFAQRMDALCHTHRIGEPEPWLDNQQVCQLLNISKRTLQTLRGNGSLSYTQINHKVYYRAEDVRSFLAVLEARRKHDQKRRNRV